MDVLPPALAALAQYRQFIVCRYSPSTSKPGKTDKFPVDWNSGRLADAHDASIWLGPDEAIGMAKYYGAGHGVGFVFTTADPFFFVDIDACLEPDGRWSSVAQGVLSWFPGAAVEISHSGTGLHIFGKGTCPPHKKRAPSNWFELYTELRFVALTGTGAMGDAGTDHSAALATCVATYLQPDAADMTDWDDAVTRGRDVRWNGPADDAELIRRALMSRSAASVFSNKASFADLWTANGEALARAYPDPVRAYDASKADSALAQHLAFWTGKDAERTLRLMNLSALRRPKWDDRGDYYLPRTIMATSTRQVDVLQDAPAMLPAHVPQPTAAAPVDGAAIAVPNVGDVAALVTGETFLSPQDQLAVFNGCTYVRQRHRVLAPGGWLMKPDQFRAMYGGYKFILDHTNNAVSNDPWEAFIQSRSVRHPRAEDICFRPELPPGAITREGGVARVNIWWPIETEMAPGDVSKMTNHLHKLLPNIGDHDQLMAYLAAMRQYPGFKMQWAPFIQGTEGNGKTIIGRAIAFAVGDRYTHIPNIDDIANGNKFTGWIEQKLFILLEEVVTKEKVSLIDNLKPIVTNERMEIQNKGADQATGDNRANLMAFSNYRTGIPKREKDRRWYVLFTAQQSDEDLQRDGMTGNYFPDLWDWFYGRNAYAGQVPGRVAFNYYLLHYPIPDALNPTTTMLRAPKSSCHDEAIRLGLGRAEQEILEAIDAETYGFCGDWISSIALDQLLVDTGMSRSITRFKRAELMQQLGYELHPGLRNGRVDNPLKNGQKPRLFCRKNSIPFLNLKTPAEVAHHYERTQEDRLLKNAKFGT